MKRSQWQNAETSLYAPPVRRSAIFSPPAAGQTSSSEDCPRKDKRLCPLPQKMPEHLL